MTPRTQGQPASQQTWTVEYYDEDEGWLMFDDAVTGCSVYTNRDTARKLAAELDTDTSPARVVQWQRMATSERQRRADFESARIQRTQARHWDTMLRHPAVS